MYRNAFTMRSDGVGLEAVRVLRWGLRTEAARPTSSMRWSTMSDMGASREEPDASSRSISGAAWSSLYRHATTRRSEPKLLASMVRRLALANRPEGSYSNLMRGVEMAVMRTMEKVSTE
uniref:Uncharacterized protein n=1 Tax=Arundo donax TaxID=35708 RepID=A0A0A9A9I6_ARUDO